MSIITLLCCAFHCEFWENIEDISSSFPFVCIVFLSAHMPVYISSQNCHKGETLIKKNPFSYLAQCGICGKCLVEFRSVPSVWTYKMQKLSEGGSKTAILLRVTHSLLKPNWYCPSKITCFLQPH